MRKWIYAIPLLLFVLFGTEGSQAQENNQIVVLQIDGPVTPIMANYFERGLEAAERQEAVAMLVMLDTPGGALNTTLDIVRQFRTSSIPIIVYVGPRGAQAASAGSIITAAAHAAGMAPETVIGAASPIGMDGSDIGETAYRKAVEDLKAVMRSLTQRRGPEAMALGEAMIEDARAVTAAEALEAGFIDVVADSVDSLLVQLDGFTVEVGEQAVTLRTANADLQPIPLSFMEQLLFILANPLLIGILLTIGAQAIIFEISNPGGWIPGIIGVVCIALALFGAGQLPVNWLGMGLILIAFVLFIAEAVTTATGGALAIAGAITLLGGLLVLFNSPGTPDFARISIPGALGITLFTAGFFLFLVAKVFQSRRTRTRTGAEGMVEQVGVARADFQANEKYALYEGSVLVMGEIWRAQSEDPITKGDQVVVKAMHGFTLRVKKL